MGKCSSPKDTLQDGDLSYEGVHSISFLADIIQKHVRYFLSLFIIKRSESENFCNVGFYFIHSAGVH